MKYVYLLINVWDPSKILHYSVIGIYEDEAKCERVLREFHKKYPQHFDNYKMLKMEVFE